MKHSIILLLGILLGFLALSGFAAELRDAMQQRSMRGSDGEEDSPMGSTMQKKLAAKRMMAKKVKAKTETVSESVADVAPEAEGASGPAPTGATGSTELDSVKSGDEEELLADDANLSGTVLRSRAPARTHAR